MNILQIAHDPAGPFAAICHQYNAAFIKSGRAPDGLSGLGSHDVPGDVHVTTLYLQGETNPDVIRATGGDEVIFFEQGQGTLRGIKFASLFKLARLFRQRRFDVVIAHRYKPIYLAGIMSFFFPIRLLLAVAHEHSIFRRPTRRLFMTFWRPMIAIAAVSRSVRDDVAKTCPGVSERGRLHVLPNALDVPAQQRQLLDRGTARRALGLPAEGFVYGTVGRLIGKKDHDALIRAFARLEDDSHLVLIGGGTRLDDITALVHRCGVAGQVTLAGHVPGAMRYLRALDAFVFPSGRAEAFGLVLLEAMLARLPIICSDAPGPREVVDRHAFSFEVGNDEDLARAMRDLRDTDGDALATMTESARQRLIRHYSYGAFHRQFWDLPPLRRVLHEMARGG